MPKPTSINISENYVKKAKSLKKKDPVWIGRRCYTVKEKFNNSGGRTELVLQWGSKKEKDQIHMTVPSKLEFNVRVNRHIHTK